MIYVIKGMLELATKLILASIVCQKSVNAIIVFIREQFINILLKFVVYEVLLFFDALNNNLNCFNFESTKYSILLFERNKKFIILCEMKQTLNYILKELLLQKNIIVKRQKIQEGKIYVCIYPILSSIIIMRRSKRDTRKTCINRSPSIIKYRYTITLTYSQ